MVQAITLFSHFSTLITLFVNIENWYQLHTYWKLVPITNILETGTNYFDAYVLMDTGTNYIHIGKKTGTTEVPTQLVPIGTS
jgi:hypothetical protein